MAKINNLEDLLAEKYRLEAEVRVQKEMIQIEVLNLKRKLNPFNKVLEFFGVGDSSRQAPQALKTGTNVGIELIGHKLLARAGWLTRLVVPLVAKRVSSFFLDRFHKRKARISAK